MKDFIIFLLLLMTALAILINTTFSQKSLKNTKRSATNLMAKLCFFGKISTYINFRCNLTGKHTNCYVINC